MKLIAASLILTTSFAEQMFKVESQNQLTKVKDKSKLTKLN